MKTIIKIFTVMILVISSLQAGAFEKVADSSATKVIMSSQKPLTIGNNTIKLSIENEKYKTSEVTLKVFMPAMPGMPYMESASDATSLGNGKFEVNLNLSMSGTWQVQIFITPKTGKKVRVKSSLNI